MATTITAVTPDAEASRILVGVATDAAHPYVELNRSSDSGRTWLVVRGENTNDWTTTYVPAPRPLYDYEAPFDTPIRYRVRGWSADKSSVSAFSLMTRPYELQSPPGHRWVLSPVSDATNRLMVLTRSARTDRRDIEQGIFYALGRPDPVVTSDVRRSRTGSMTLLANDDGERDSFTRLTETVDVICVRTPGDHWWGTRYVVLGDAQWQRVADRPDDAWDVILPWTEVANPPIPIAPAGATYADVADRFDIYADLPPEFATYTDLAAWVP